MLRLVWWAAPMAALLFTSGAHGSRQATDTKRPNVLFLLTDDQRADTIGALGNPHIRTPHLDTLANRGYAFTNAYCLGADIGAVCTPSRNMLLSGNAYFRFGRQAPPDGPNLPTSLRQAGYETYHHGKRGNTAPAIQALFEHNRYLADDHAERRTGEPGREIADAAVRFLAERKRDRPFFMYLAFGNPHDPRVAAQRYLDQYDRERIPLPKNYRPFHPFDNGELKVRDEQLAPWPRTEAEVRRHLHEYYAVITAVDEQIGRVLQTLKTTGEYERTLIVFSSDHGLAVGSHGLMGKQSLYEHSMKVPLILAGPGIPRGRTGAFAYLLDVHPTICDLAGAPAPQGIDGVSQAPVVRGKRPQVRDAVFTAYRDVQRSLRQGPWKLIRYPQINKTQLFDLEGDPDEIHDLAGNPAQPSRVEAMLRLLRERQRHYGDRQPLSSGDPRPAAVDLTFFQQVP